MQKAETRKNHEGANFNNVSEPLIDFFVCLISMLYGRNILLTATKINLM